MNVTLQSPDRDNIVYIVGADTYLGMHLCKHFTEHGFRVYGCGKTEAKEIVAYCQYKKSTLLHYSISPQKYAWFLFCHDPHDGYDEHIAALRAFCDSLRNVSVPVRVVYPSSTTICQKHGATVQENDPLIPHNRLEMTIVSGENWLQTYSYESNGKIIPYIFRLCDLYGSEFLEMQGTGFVNHILKKAINEKNLPVPGLGLSSRNMCHISDACESLIAVLRTPVPPQCLNIPGERYQIAELISKVAKKFHLEPIIDRGENWDDDYSKYSGDLHVSKSFFNHVVNYIPKYKFKNWLGTL